MLGNFYVQTPKDKCTYWGLRYASLPIQITANKLIMPACMCKNPHPTSRKTYFCRESIFMHKVHHHSWMQTIRYVQTADSTACCSVTQDRCQWMHNDRHQLTLLNNANLQITDTGSSLMTTDLWSTITHSDTNSVRLCYWSKFYQIFCPWHSM